MNKKTINDYLWITLSACLTAIAVNFFFRSTGLAPGGITGLAIVSSTFIGIPIEYMTLWISIPLLILATFLLGKSFGIKTLYITLITPIWMHIIPSMDFFHTLPFLLNLSFAGVFGGLLVGSSIGIALNHDCATGGTDVMALLIQKVLKHIKLSHILFCLDGFVIIASGLITQNIFISIFSLLTLWVIISTISYITAHKKGIVK